MGIIQSYNPQEAEEKEIKRREGVKQLALGMLDDTGMLREAMDEEAGCNDQFMKDLACCVRDHMNGKHPDCFYLGRDLMQLVEKYILEVADKEYME